MSSRRRGGAVPLGVAIAGILAPLSAMAGPPARVGIVDRIEGEYAVVEWDVDGFADVPLGLLPPGVREGDQVLLPKSPRAGGRRRPRLGSRGKRPRQRPRRQSPDATESAPPVEPPSPPSRR